MFNYSPELVKRIKIYFSKKYNLVITNKEADEYLDSLADLYLLFTRD